MWTEFFDSELWSRTVLQLSNNEPAIKHGILALSIMHEWYEGTLSMSAVHSHGFAFVQYMQAVKHSNQLLTAYQEGKASLEMVLIACIIFTSYENLAGNFRAAGMHLRNGLRILDQNKHTMGTWTSLTRGAIANSLYRFDLEAMTFSDNASLYDYVLDQPPVCPHVHDTYTTNSTARDDIVGILRCMMWLAGVLDRCPGAAESTVWLRVHREISRAMKQWETAFDEYRKRTSLQGQPDLKVYAGDTLLKMIAILLHIIVGSAAAIGTEMAWDPFIDSFKAIVDLAETVPILPQAHPTRSTRSRKSPSSNISPAGPRLLAPNPATTSSTPSSNSSTAVFSLASSQTIREPSTWNENNVPPNSLHVPSHFSPSFELSPIVPLFVVGCRCRDPIIRRRAIALLLSYRRREGVWDSLGAGMVAAQCMKREENLDPGQPLDLNNVARLLELSTAIKSCSDVPESARVKDIHVSVKTVGGRIDLVYSMTTGENTEEQQVFYESRGDGVVRDESHPSLDLLKRQFLRSRTFSRTESQSP
jgi:hypothetical protein